MLARVALIAGWQPAIRYVFAISGKINSADIYVSNNLFKKLWNKMLKAAAVEAVANIDENVAVYVTVTPDNVLSFLNDSAKGHPKKRSSQEELTW